VNEFLKQFVNLLVPVLYLSILARVIVSWIPISEDSRFAPVVRVIYQVTEPILGPIRRLIPGLGMLDLSPMIAIILLMVIQRIVVAAL
jgi:YggT family protein